MIPAMVFVMMFAAIMIKTLMAVIEVLMFMHIAMRHVFVSIPLILHEEDALAAGIVFVAMATPVAAMIFWNMQVHRLGFDCRSVGDDDRCRQDEYGWVWQAADIDAAEYIH
jgi:hypothetical protein